jgi:transposase InsO family protein
MEVPSAGGHRYFVLFIDDLTRYTSVAFMKNKSETLEHFRAVKAHTETFSGVMIALVRSDTGGEYTSGAFEAELRQAGTGHQTTAPYTPEQNGVAERANRTIVESARCMLLESGLSKSFWAEAVRTAVHLKNRLPTIAVQDKTPYEAWFGQ